jgi:hypothetical protein
MKKAMVVSKDYAGKSRVLVFEETLKPVPMGAELKTFRGEVVRVVGGQAPHKPSSSGRVHVENVDNGWASEFFPGVVGATWL